MNHGYPQQQGYGAPPSHSPYPPQQGYGAPPVPQHPGHSPYPQQGFAPPSGPPPGQYGAPQGQYGAPQGQYGAPPGPPPGQYGAPPGPPPGQYGAPHGAPPGQYGAPQGPPPGQYGAPQQHAQYGAPSGPPSPPSPGYVHGQVAPMDMSREADQVRSAMKGFGTDEKLLTAVMSRLDPLQAAGLKQTFNQRHRRDLLADLEKETSGYFREGLLAIARGPLEQDCFNLNKAIKGLGTKESVLNDVLLSRTNADINAIKTHYQHMYRRSLESDLKGDLSMKTERLFTMILAGRRNEESSPVMPQQTDADVAEMYRATEGQKMGTDQVTVCSILSSRSDGQIRAISLGYKQKYHRSLGEVIKKNFSGHMEDALVFMLEHAEDRAKHDAWLLEDTMKGMGTKDDNLVNRTVRIHWDKARMGQARAAYRHFYKQDLSARIRGETRGDYEKLMVALVESGL